MEPTIRLKRLQRIIIIHMICHTLSLSIQYRALQCGNHIYSKVIWVWNHRLRVRVWIAYMITIIVDTWLGELQVWCTWNKFQRINSDLENSIELGRKILIQRIAFDWHLISPEIIFRLDQTCSIEISFAKILSMNQIKEFGSFPYRIANMVYTSDCAIRNRQTVRDSENSENNVWPTLTKCHLNRSSF